MLPNLRVQAKNKLGKIPPRAYRVKRNSPRALWVNCSGHCLNLVIVHSCKLTAIRNMLGKLTETCLFFRDRPKRASLSEKIVSKSVMQTHKRKAILDLCKTRWAMRHTGYSYFCTSYVFIVKALEVIAHGLHREEVSELFQDGWDPSSRARASAILNAVCSFNFIITFLVVYKMLTHLSGITVKLQGSTIEVLQAFSEIESIKDNYKSLRTDINKQFHRIYEHAVFVAAKVNVEPERPRKQEDRLIETMFLLLRMKIRLRVTFNEPWRFHFWIASIWNLMKGFQMLYNKCSGLLRLIPSVITNKNGNFAVTDQQIREAI